MHRQLLLDLTQPTLTVDQMRLAIMQAKDANLYGVCVLPGLVRSAHTMVARSQLQVRTLVGFPGGVHTASVKGLETRLALQEGADEVVRRSAAAAVVAARADPRVMAVDRRPEEFWSVG